MKRNSVLPIMLACALAISFAAEAQVREPSPAERQIQHGKAADAFKRAEKLTKAAKNPKLPDVDVSRIGALPDPSQVAQRYAAMQPGQDSTLYVMVSYSMPTEALERIAMQAERAGAIMVLRGLVKGSMKETVTRSQALVDRFPRAQMQINPNIFRQFAVRQVPTFVLTRDETELKSCTKACDASAHFVSVAGDVSLEYALEHVVKRGEPKFQELAEQRIKLIRGE